MNIMNDFGGLVNQICDLMIRYTLMTLKNFILSSYLTIYSSFPFFSLLPNSCTTKWKTIRKQPLQMMLTLNIRDYTI